MDFNLSKLWKIMKDREAWHAVIHGVTKSRTRLSDWTELTEVIEGGALLNVISTLVRAIALASSFCFSSTWGHNEKSAVCNLKEPDDAGTSILDFQPAELREIV